MGPSDAKSTPSSTHPQPPPHPSRAPRNCTRVPLPCSFIFSPNSGQCKCSPPLPPGGGGGGGFRRGRSSGRDEAQIRLVGSVDVVLEGLTWPPASVTRDLAEVPTTPVAPLCVEVGPGAAGALQPWPLFEGGRCPPGPCQCTHSIPSATPCRSTSTRISPNPLALQPASLAQSPSHKPAPPLALFAPVFWLALHAPPPCALTSAVLEPQLSGHSPSPVLGSP